MLARTVWQHYCQWRLLVVWRHLS